MLRLPMVVRHTISEDSPLANWRSGQAGMAADASSEIAVVASPFLLFQESRFHKKFGVMIPSSFLRA